MKKLLTSDVYQVRSSYMLDLTGYKTVLQLYQPLIGMEATALYLTLNSELDQMTLTKSPSLISRLCKLSGFSLNSLQESFDKLEAVGLVCSYVKQTNDNRYLFDLKMPLSPQEFINHQILDRLLKDRLKDEYEKTIAIFQTYNVNLNDYQEMTASFTDVFEIHHHEKNILKENEISINKDCNYIDKFVENPFFIVKSKMNHVILKCKLTNTNEITDEFAEKHLENREKIEETVNKATKIKQPKLESLVGIENIKEEVNKIVNYVKICKKRNKGMPTLHMCFTGNPGTGKTTVARIVGEIFRKEKILSRGQFVEIHGRDLVGKYVGWTAKEVKDQIQRAKGGVLFIDEAYSLNSDVRGSFEDEAIATLIKEMEDKRDDICIILAGYQKEMEDLIKRNPGFESRIQFYLDFPNYNEDELYEIFKKLAKKEGYKISRNVKEILQEDFKKKSKSKNFTRICNIIQNGR